MMLHKNAFIYIGLLLLTVFIAEARGNSSNGTNAIVSLGIHDSGNAIVELATSANTEGCSTPSLKNLILIQKTNPNFKEMYATAIFAMATGRPITGWVNGCTDVWGGGGTVIVNATTLGVAK